ncbi:MAG: hypothetical protein LBS85_03460 [Clostridiales Family XIII bacterium]|jgi:hypothetical protein|nr:hypothetical protein [Clostridiales Family XIII bacterium]
MARSWKAKREIKRNIAGYRETRRGSQSGALTYALMRVCAVLLAVMIPFTAALFAGNIIFRVPDLYSFEIGRSEILKDLELSVSADEIADAISEYMMHKSEELSVTAEVRGKQIPVFGFMEQVRVHALRGVLDKSFVVMCAMAVLSAVFFVLVLFFGRKKYLRHSFLAAIAVYIAIMCGTLYLAAADGALDPLMEKLLGDAPRPGDLLPEMFGQVFRMEAFAAVFVISLFVFVIVYSIAKRLTREEERMFA